MRPFIAAIAAPILLSAVAASAQEPEFAGWKFELKGDAVETYVAPDSHAKVVMLDLTGNNEAEALSSKEALTEYTVAFSEATGVCEHLRGPLQQAEAQGSIVRAKWQEGSTECISMVGHGSGGTYFGMLIQSTNETTGNEAKLRSALTRRAEAVPDMDGE